MTKKYFVSFAALLFGFYFNSAFGQALPDFGSTPNGSATTVVIANVLANDTYFDLPATLSEVYFSQISKTTNYLDVDTDTGAVIFTNGPAPIGTYYLDYIFNAIGDSTQGTGTYGHVTVNIGCEDLPAPIVSSVMPPSCATPGSVVLTGLPATGSWELTDFPRPSLFGSGTSVIVENVEPGWHIYRIINYQGCCSLSVQVNVDYLTTSLSGVYSDANADGIPNAGDVINYQCTLTNVSSCQVTNIQSYGVPLTETVLPFLAPGATHNFIGIYVLEASDFNTNYVRKFVGFTGDASIEQTGTYIYCRTYYQSQPDGIKLVAYVDTNANGIKDINEQEFHNGSFNYEINNDGIQHYLASGDSPVIYESDPTRSYDLNFMVYSDYNNYYTLSAGPYNDVSVALGSGITSYYFPLTALTSAPHIDTAISMYGTNPRPGFTYTNTIVYSNNGSEIIPAGTVTFTKDNAVSIIAVSGNAATMTPTGFTYDFTNLLPGEWDHIVVTMQVPTIPTVALGQSLINSVAVSAPTGDVNVNNNFDISNRTIIGSYDPNDKAESHGSKILYSGFTADDYLTYTIQFENTGTANAEFVRVVDVLDDRLDETTVRMVDASDAYTLNRVGNNLEWFFDNIQLLPSVPETTTGHGYIVFQVKPKPDYALGDIISNSADIYFDFNPAIVTNTFTSEFVNTLHADTFAFNQLRCYPNPVKSSLFISNDSLIDSVAISSVLGQELISKSVKNLKAEFNLSALANGVYFVKIVSGDQVKTIRIVKD